MAPLPAIVPVTPAPLIQKYARPVHSISLKGVQFPIQKKLMAKIIVEQLDTNVFQVQATDDNGQSKQFTIFVPDENEY